MISSFIVLHDLIFDNSMYMNLEYVKSRMGDSININVITMIVNIGQCDIVVGLTGPD